MYMNIYRFTILIFMKMYYDMRHDKKITNSLEN